MQGSYAILLFTASDLASITSHIHSWVLFLLLLHPFILSGVISPLISSSILGTYWPGEFLFQYPIISPFHSVHGILKVRILKWKPKKVKVTQSCPALCNPMDYRVLGILQARILEFPTLQADSLPAEPPGKPKNTGVGSLSLLKRIFLTQESNRGLLHCRQVLYQLSYQGNGKPPQYSCLENSMDRGAWWATVHGVARVRHNLPTKPPTHCFLLIISTLQMRKLRLRLNNFPKSQQVTEWLSIVFDFQRQNSIHCSILTGRWGEKQINTHSLNIGLFAFRWDNKKRS